MYLTNRLIKSNIFLKFTSFITALLLWNMLNNFISSTMWISAPLCFYNMKKNFTIEAPEIISIQLKGKKSIIDQIKNEQIAVHINAQNLNFGINPYIITSENLLLPPSISLIDYKPRKLLINLQQT